jgi:hypothetical protein
LELHAAHGYMLHEFYSPLTRLGGFGDLKFGSP